MQDTNSIVVPQRMKDEVLEALEAAGIEPVDVHVDVGSVHIEIEDDYCTEAVEVVSLVLQEGF